MMLRFEALSSLGRINRAWHGALRRMYATSNNVHQCPWVARRVAKT
jgi:hypothetical protein